MAIDPAKKLAIYNIALGHLGERSLANLSENREPRRVLDDYWSPALRSCLESGDWKFALRAVRRSPEQGNPDFGFDNAFLKPSDLVRLVRISERELLDIPLTHFRDQGPYWYADSDFIYVQYVSEHSNYGHETSNWTQLFQDYLALRLANLAASRIVGITPSKADEGNRVSKLQAAESIALGKALEHNALNDAPPYDVVRHCLEQANWKFALRTAEIDPSNTVSPAFGFTNAFLKPTDWVRTQHLSQSETFEPPLLRFNEEQGHWYADCDPLFVRYVSIDADYGLNQSAWPQMFRDYLRARIRLLTYMNGPDPTVSVVEKLQAMERKALSDARNNNLIATAPEMQMSGSWVTSRGGNRNRYSRWNGQMQ